MVSRVRKNAVLNTFQPVGVKPVRLAKWYPEIGTFFNKMPFP
jgi:hypothetical protein